MQGGEHIDYGYTGTTAIPKEVRTMKTTVLKLFGFSFSGKQLGLSAIAVVIFYGLLKILLSFGLDEIGIAIALFAALPFIVLAFVKKHGLDYDDWLMVRRANTKYSSPIRRNNGLNEFEKLEDLCREKKKKTKRRKRIKGAHYMKAFR